MLNNGTSGDMSCGTEIFIHARCIKGRRQLGGGSWRHTGGSAEGWCWWVNMEMGATRLGGGYHEALSSSAYAATYDMDSL